MPIKTAWIGGSYCAAARLDPKTLAPNSGSRPEKQDPAKDVLDAIRREPGMPWAEIARSAGLSPNAGQGILSALRRDGKIRSESLPAPRGGRREISVWFALEQERKNAH